MPVSPMFLQIARHLLLIVLVVSALGAVSLRNFLSSVMALLATGLLLSLQFYVLQAPDVAITEAAVGVGVLVAVFLVAIARTEGLQ